MAMTCMSAGCCLQQRSVLECTEEFKKRDLPLDCLISSAGVIDPPDDMTPEGFEVQAHWFISQPSSTPHHVTMLYLHAAAVHSVCGLK